MITNPDPATGDVLKEKKKNKNKNNMAWSQSRSLNPRARQYIFSLSLSLTFFLILSHSFSLSLSLPRLPRRLLQKSYLRAHLYLFIYFYSFKYAELLRQKFANNGTSKRVTIEVVSFFFSFTFSLWYSLHPKLVSLVSLSSFELARRQCRFCPHFLSHATSHLSSTFSFSSSTFPRLSGEKQDRWKGRTVRAVHFRPRSAKEEKKQTKKKKKDYKKKKK